jgi:hypothetical protein
VLAALVLLVADSLIRFDYRCGDAFGLHDDAPVPLVEKFPALQPELGNSHGFSASFERFASPPMLADRAVA